VLKKDKGDHASDATSIHTQHAYTRCWRYKTEYTTLVVDATQNAFCELKRVSLGAGASSKDPDTLIAQGMATRKHLLGHAQEAGKARPMALEVC
jgi:hypothetical protein